MSENKIYRILIADDEAELVDAMSLYLKRAGFETIRAEDGLKALEAFETYHPDLILLDVMMPGMNGFSVLKEIRKKSHIPAIMLTVRNDSDDMVLGLDTGADDYITKPYDPREVVARVKAQLRRSYSYTDVSDSTEEKPIISGDLILDPGKKSVTKGGNSIAMSATEYKILELLMSSPGKIFTKRQIYESAWSGDFMSDDNTIMVRISNIRHKIQDDPKDPKIITVKGLGYKFEG